MWILICQKESIEDNAVRILKVAFADVAQIHRSGYLDNHLLEVGSVGSRPVISMPVSQPPSKKPLSDLVGLSSAHVIDAAGDEEYGKR